MRRQRFVHANIFGQSPRRHYQATHCAIPKIADIGLFDHSDIDRSNPCYNIGLAHEPDSSTPSCRRIAREARSTAHATSCLVPLTPLASASNTGSDYTLAIPHLPITP